jgi:putative phosphoribosyl transferase
MHIGHHAMFTNRIQAGGRLAERLTDLAGPDLVVLGLPRGGVAVAFALAEALHAPLDVVVVRKLGAPFQPELAMGAVGEGDALVLNERVVQAGHVSEAGLAESVRCARAEVARYAELFRGTRPRTALDGRTALVVDDGIATGATARAACQVVRAQGAARVVLASPVCSPSAAALLGEDVDQLVCLLVPADFAAVGQFYDDFRPVPDATVVELLRRAGSRDAGPSPAADPPTSDLEIDSDVEIPAAHAALPGRLTVPPRAPGLVLFVHGSGSSRHSPRNQYVASQLRQVGLGTLLFDLLTPGEERDRRAVFDVELLASRLTTATRWVRGLREVRGLPIGYFGASTGAAAALWAAADDAEIVAVVSRGGRPDLAAPRLAEVQAPTLLIVGARDENVLGLNRRALTALRAGRLAIVPGATHLFEEPGTLEQAAGLAAEWFRDHFAG